MGVILDNIVKTNTAKKETATTKQTKTENTPKQEFETFDISKVKSTVKNPSTKFKGISVEDEKRIMDIVNKQFGGSSKFEKQQAIQWLYNSALKAQKKKDIEAGRDEVKLQYISNKNNAKNSKEKNTWNQQIKKADLADLIKDQLGKEWYNIDDFMNVTDNWIIKWFVDENPEYVDTFNKYFYNNQSAESLGKELWWLEKTTWDKLMDKVKWFWEWVKGWMDKFWEWVDDLLWMAADNEHMGTKWDAAWINYVQDKYWVAPVNLTDDDYKRARAEFLLSDKKAYQPTLSSAVTKIMEWGTDIAFTTANPTNLLWKSWFSAANQTPWLQKVPEFLWGTMWEIWYYLNQLPIAKDIRDSLQTEQEKADWDAFVGWWFLGKWTKVGKLKNLDSKTLKNAFNDFRDGKNWFETVKKWMEENRKAKVQEEKELKAQQITQWQIETRKTASKWLDTMAERWKLDKIKNVDDLEKNTNDLIDQIKKEQTDLAKKDNKTYWENDLAIVEDVNILDKEWKATTRKQMNRAFSTLLDNIIEHYENTDKSKATTFKSYKEALKNGKLPMDIALEIRREWNKLNQNTYNNKTNLVKDTNKAEAWATNMKKVNDIFEKLDIWEELRNKDSQLSSLYTIQNWIKEIKKAEANYNKKALQEWTLDKFANKLWWYTSKILWKLSFGTTNLVWKFFVSALQEMLGWGWFKKETYNAAEIAKKIPEFVSDYKDLLKKMEWKDVSKNMANKMLRAWMNKRESTMQYNKVDQDK